MLFLSTKSLLRGGSSFAPRASAVHSFLKVTPVRLYSFVGIPKCSTSTICGLSNVSCSPNLTLQGSYLRNSVGQPRVFFKSFSATQPKQGQSDPPKKKSMLTLVKEYGFWFFGYWTATWMLTGVACYAGMVYWGESLAQQAIDYFDLEQHLTDVPQTWRNGVIALLVNEAIEPMRLPFCIATFLFFKRRRGLRR